MAAQTIFALSSGAPPAGVAVVRISGPQAGDALDALLGDRKLPPPRHAALRHLVEPVSRETLDQALVLWLPGPGTATGEDMAELHLHGSRAVVAALLSALERMEGLSPAEAGAFTKRAFENGRMDLSQVEGLADLLAAETEMQRRSALALAEGALGHLVEDWRQRVLHIAAQLEAALDFSDEGDVTEQVDLGPAAVLANEARHWLDAPSAERLRDGVRVVLAGPPNAGKSTLLNALVGRDAAITSPIAGTTRDIVEVPVSLAGTPFVFTDTAGLHETTADVIEIEGMRRAQTALERADIILWLGTPQSCPDASRAIFIVAKSDEGGQARSAEELAISAKRGDGMDHLRHLLLDRAAALLPTPGVIAINARQRVLIAELATELTAAYQSHDHLLCAEHLRLACRALDRLVGRTGVEDMLDTLFGGFCIGK